MSSPRINKLGQVHLIVGGFPSGSHAGHDMDYARLRLLNLFYKRAEVTASADFSNLEQALKGASLLVTYTAGPFPDDAQTEFMRGWLQAGGNCACVAKSANQSWVNLFHQAAGLRCTVLPGGRLLNHDKKTKVHFVGWFRCPSIRFLAVTF